MIECGPKCSLGDHCLNKRFQKLQSAKVEVFKTRKKGWGLRTTTELPANSFIMEYVGEVVRNKEFKSRVKKYTKQKVKHHYFMKLRNDEIIDATVKGNVTRFINHSCEPNCETQKWAVNGDPRIGFFTLRDLKAGEEITFDYQFQRYGRKAQKCYCEAPSCRGYIGGKEQSLSVSAEADADADEDVDADADADDEDKKERGSPGFKIPKLNRLQRMELEQKMEEVMNDEQNEIVTEKSNIEQKIPFARNYFPKPPAATNGLVNGTTTPKISNIPTIKRRFDSLTNNIDLTPTPQLSKEERRLQFEMNAKMKEYYDAIKKNFGAAVLEQVKLSHPAFSQNRIPPLPPFPSTVHPPVPPPSLPVLRPISANQNPHLIYPNLGQETEKNNSEHQHVSTNPVLPPISNSYHHHHHHYNHHHHRVPHLPSNGDSDSFINQNHRDGKDYNNFHDSPYHDSYAKLKKRKIDSIVSPVVAIVPSETASKPVRPEPTNLPTLIVLANNSIEPAHVIDDELAFSICDYDEYYTVRNEPLKATEVNNNPNPYPGIYYTTPSGEKWFAAVALDRKTQKPRTVILKLESDAIES